MSYSEPHRLDCPRHETKRDALHPRRHPRGARFARLWEPGEEVAAKRLTSVASSRALNGVRRAVWKNGELVGEERRDDPRLLIFPMRTWTPCATASCPTCSKPPFPTRAAQLPAGLNALQDLDDPGEPGEGAA